MPPLSLSKYQTIWFKLSYRHDGEKGNDMYYPIPEVKNTYNLSAKFNTSYEVLNYDSITDRAWVRSKAGWVCLAHRPRLDEDGRIFWAYSTDGHWEKEGDASVERSCQNCVHMDGCLTRSGYIFRKFILTGRDDEVEKAQETLNIAGTACTKWETRN